MLYISFSMKIGCNKSSRTFPAWLYHGFPGQQFLLRVQLMIVLDIQYLFTTYLYYYIQLDAVSAAAMVIHIHARFGMTQLPAEHANGNTLSRKPLGKPWKHCDTFIPTYIHVRILCTLITSKYRYYRYNVCPLCSNMYE